MGRTPPTRHPVDPRFWGTGGTSRSTPRAGGSPAAVGVLDTEGYQSRRFGTIPLVIARFPDISPPSMGRVTPLIQDAASDAKKSSASAISSGVPTRPSGYHWA